MARITDENILMERAIKMLPKGIPASAIKSVECDPYDGSNGGGSYWVYLADGYWCPTMGCHTIHEDTLKELKSMIAEVEIWADDPAFDDPSQGYGPAESAAVEAATRAALDRAGLLAQEEPAQEEPKPAPRTRYVRADYESGTISAREALRWHRAGLDILVCRRGRGAVLVHGAPQERPQERDENRETCRRIALDLEAHANGEYFRCPECGQEHRTPDNLGDKYRCPNCGAVSDFDDLEFLGLYDYFSDFLDIDWILDSNREYKACRIMVTCGGPNIFVDTYSGNIELYWWNERASFPLLSEARTAVDDWAEEYWTCCG